MQELDDHELLAQYARDNSEQAYATLVARHLNLVYSVALRHVAQPHQAEEIAQAVFLILAKKAGSLSRQVILTGWLYRTARLTAANYLRMEKRRQSREQEAYMQSLAHEPEPDVWTQIAPILDTAMEQLGPRDRDAILLRFFEDKSLKEVGTALRASETATQKRVERALKKLRDFFTKRGVTLSVATLMGLLSSQSVQAAPTGLTETITTAGLAKGAAASGSTLLLVKSTMKIMTWLKIKTAVVVGVSAILVAGTTTVTVAQMQQQAVANDPPAPAQSFQTSTNSSSPPLSEADAKDKSIAALVNQIPIYWPEVDRRHGEIATLLRQRFKDDDLKQKMARSRQVFLRALIERELIIESFKSSESPIPDSYVNAQIDDIVKNEYGGSRENFLSTLTTSGSSLDKYKEEIVDLTIVKKMRDKFVTQKVDDYFAQNPQLLTGDLNNQETLRAAESEKVQTAWIDSLYAKAIIRTFPDPGEPDSTSVPITPPGGKVSLQGYVTAPPNPPPPDKNPLPDAGYLKFAPTSPETPAKP